MQADDKTLALNPDELAAAERIDFPLAAFRHWRAHGQTHVAFHSKLERDYWARRIAAAPARDPQEIFLAPPEEREI